MSVEPGACGGPTLSTDRQALLRLRRELVAYLHRLVVHPHGAEDLAQETFLRAHLARDRAPSEPQGHRRWMFAIATNLAIDYLRRERRRSVFAMQGLREDAENDPAFVERSKALIGTPETALLAHEHLAACFACTLSNVPEGHAAALLLVEVHQFSVLEAAEALGVSFASAKNAIQQARRMMIARYDSTCALINKQGVCHQCDELASYFGADPVRLSGGKWRARRARLQQLRERAPGVWHTLLLRRLDPKPGDGTPS